MPIKNLSTEYSQGRMTTTEVLTELESAMDIPLSEGQKGLWALYRMNPVSTGYNVPLCIKVKNLNFDHLSTALSLLIKQYPIINTYIKEKEDGIFLSKNAIDVSLGYIDISNLNEIQVIEHLESLARVPFQLEKEPLFRITVLDTSRAEVYLLIVAQHILLDGGSTIVLLDTLINSYVSLNQDDVVNIDASVPSYAEFVEWEKCQLSLSGSKDDQEYWAARLENVDIIENMPTKSLRCNKGSCNGEFTRFRLPIKISKKVDKYCSDNQVSEAAFYLSVFKCLIYRYSGSSDLTIGVPLNVKPDQRFDRVVGHFINMLPVRSNIQSNMSFDTLVSIVKGNLIDAIDHGFFPFSHQVRASGGEQRLSESPVFSISYNYQSMVSGVGLETIRKRFEKIFPFDFVEQLYQSGEYDLGLDVIPGDKMELIIKYNPSLYSEVVIDRMTKHFAMLVKSAVTRSSEYISELEMITPKEKKKLLTEWNQTKASYPLDKTCYQLFLNRVTDTPEACAVMCNKVELSFNQLNHKVVDTSRHLVALGAQPGDRVGIYLGRSADIVVAQLAVMRVGCVYVPLDPNYPKERVSYMVNDSGCQFILTEKTLLDSAEDNFGKDIRKVIVDQPCEHTEHELIDQIYQGDNTLPAYIIYTSGSTGKPKGVVVSHQSLTNCIVAVKKQVDYRPGESLLAVTTYCFDIAGIEIYMPLISGGTCIVADTDTIKDAERLKDTVSKLKPKYLPGTPATFEMLFKVGWKNEDAVKIICAGDKITDHLKSLFDRYECNVWNFYGPTETTIYSTVKKLSTNEPVTIGVPIANTTVYVLDKNLRLLPAGVRGELYIGGDGVSLGYWQNEELTSARFLESPFKPGEKVYRTGDMVRWLESGELELVGRIDNQIKIRGYRIELGEIEAVLSRHDNIESCVVVCYRNNDHNIIRAVYIPNQDATDSRSIRNFISCSLPSYMVPDEFIAVEEYPLTPNGKIDRKYLSSDVLAASKPACSISKNRDPNYFRSRIRDIFVQALGHSDFSDSDAFFSIGGDSLKAIDVMESINKALSFNEKVTSLFRYPTISTLDEYLKKLTDYDSNTSVTCFDSISMNLASESISETDHTSLGGYDRDTFAIVGISCQFPGAKDHNEFWSNLCSGIESIDIVSSHELRKFGVPDQLIADPNFIAKRAVIEDKDKFDAEFFGISPRDAELMDPQARLLLLHAWKVVEDAGYIAENIPNTSVFVSASNNFYQALLPGFLANMTDTRILDNADEYVAWLLAQGGTIPTMISNKLNFQGPSLFVSSNCSSSLSSLSLACQGLASGDCDFALVGASTLFPANTLGYIYQAGLNFSGAGHCRAFDDSADGMIGGEGVAAVLVRRANDAVRDGDNIYALIRGVAVNNDGAEKVGFYAPGVGGQSSVISKALKKAGVSAESIRFIEAHGTGTKLGDPIEVAALVDAYRNRTKKRQYCAIGSVKSNIGHLDTAAGLAGLIKTALSLKYSELPPTINFSEENKNIDFRSSPFYVASSREYLSSSKDEPLRAGVSSFGIGGTNTHAILEKCYIECVRVSDRKPQVVILSAKNRDRLKESANTLSRFLVRSNEIALSDIAHTLQVGRKAMDHRLAIIVDNVDDLCRALSRYAEDEQTLGLGFSGRVEETTGKVVDLFLSDEIIRVRLDNWFKDGNLSKIAESWVAGFDVDWSMLYSGQHRLRVSLPSYSFAKERFWIDVHNDQVKRPFRSFEVRRQEPSCDTEEQRRVSPEPESRNVITKRVRDVVARNLSSVLKVSKSKIAHDVSFSDYGLNSISGVMLINQINDELNVNIDVTRLFDYPTVTSLYRYILHEFSDQIFLGSKVLVADSESEGSGSPDRDIYIENASNHLERSASDNIRKPTIATATIPSHAKAASLNKEPIAIVGMSGRFPQSSDVEEFWQHIVNGNDLVTEVSRWDVSKYNGHCTAGGFLNDIECFDPLFFNISGIEAVNMEPQQRIFLEESWRALEDAGCAGESLNRLKCGVYVGCASGDYINLNSEEPYAAQALWGNMSSVIPARISYFLNLDGPAVAVDTACSSSLVALNIACQAIWSGDVEMALTGGVFVQCSPRLYIAGSNAGMLSPKGRCYSFDDRADGFVPAEGAVALVLKSLSKAESDGDHIHGVIRGIGVNQDGASNGISAPSANSQQRLIESTYKEFGINCADIQMVEAHGTGTKLGDPIEFQGLTRAFSNGTDKQAYCALGTSKSNLGHAQMAAGVIGVVKILMAMKYKKIPPSVNYKTINGNISLENSPFYINTELRDWAVEEGKRRCAVVSSFGVSGTNAHVVLEDAPPRESLPKTEGSHCLLISAKTSEQLRESILRLHDHLETNKDLDIGEVAYSLWKGRRHFNRRAAFIVDSLNCAIDSINSWLINPASVRRSDPPILAAVCDRYLNGQEVDLENWFSGREMRKVPLPTYSFSKNKYWLEDESSLLYQNCSGRHALASTISGGGISLKLLESSGENESLFEVVFTGKEFFLRDHCVRNSHILPGSVYLELAKTAFDSLSSFEGKSLTLSSIVFLGPLAIEGRGVSIYIKIGGGERTEFEVYTRHNDQNVTHCRGEISLDEKVGERVDVSKLMQRYRKKSTSSKLFYQEFSEMGVDYGPAFQGIEEAYGEPGEALVKLRVPDVISNSFSDYDIHPVLVDCAMQSMKYLADEQDKGQAQLLFSISDVVLRQACQEEMWVWIRYRKTPSGEFNTSKLDAELVTKNGEVCITFRGISTRKVSVVPTVDESPKYPCTAMLSVYDAKLDLMSDQSPKPGERVVCIGLEDQYQDLICKDYPETTFLSVDPKVGTHVIERIIREVDVIDHIFWFSPRNRDALPNADTLIEDQSMGIYQVFRIFKALLNIGYGNKRLGWSFIIRRCQPVSADDVTDPTHAGVVGLIGSLAKENPNWSIRSVDVDSINADSFHDIVHISADRLGNTHLLRNREWYRQSLIPYDGSLLRGSDNRGFRNRGVYVIVGGAGGLGSAISEYLIKEYDARVVWLGRRAINSAIERQICSLGKIGTPPLYIQADASNAESLELARRDVFDQIGHVNGIIHSAMVLDPEMMSRMTEEKLASVYEAKSSVSARLVEAFNSSSLDLVLFFSTINSYMKAMGQGNYSAACTFKDAFSMRLSHELSCDVKVINLGYCFNNVEDENGSYDETEMADFISRKEFFEAIEGFVASDLKQVAFMKLTPKWSTLGMVFGEGRVIFGGKRGPSLIQKLSQVADNFDFSEHCILVKAAVDAQCDLQIKA